MGYSDYSKVCYFTEQREDNVPLRNTRTGAVGHSFGCTYEGNTVQVRLEDGSLDSWVREEIAVFAPEVTRMMSRVNDFERCIASMD